MQCYLINLSHNSTNYLLFTISTEAHSINLTPFGFYRNFISVSILNSIHYYDFHISLYVHDTSNTRKEISTWKFRSPWRTKYNLAKKFKRKSSTKKSKEGTNLFHYQKYRKLENIISKSKILETQIEKNIHSRAIKAGQPYFFGFSQTAAQCSFFFVWNHY
jgi:hypothetical protein